MLLTVARARDANGTESLLFNSFGGENILDARYLRVNRLAPKCIKGPGLIYRPQPRFACSKQVEAYYNSPAGVGL